MIENLWLMVAILYFMFVMYINLLFDGHSKHYKRGEVALPTVVLIPIGKTIYKIVRKYTCKQTLEEKMLKIIERKINN